MSITKLQHLDKKRTPEFVMEIHAMVDNDPNERINSITVGVSEFLIWQVVHEDIWHFSYKARKGQFLSQIMMDKRKDCSEKLLNKFNHPLQMNMLCFF